MADEKLERFGFNHNQWILTAVFTLVVIPLMISSIFHSDVKNAFVRKFVASKIQSEFGFTMSHNRLYYGKQALDVYAISSLESTGILAKSGFQINDVPMRILHLSDVDFYEELTQTQENPIEIKVINIDLYNKCLEARLACPLSDYQRKIKISRENYWKMPNNSTGADSDFVVKLRVKI